MNCTEEFHRWPMSLKWLVGITWSRLNINKIEVTLKLPWKDIPFLDIPEVSNPSELVASSLKSLLALPAVRNDYECQLVSFQYPPNQKILNTILIAQISCLRSQQVYYIYCKWWTQSKWSSLWKKKKTNIQMEPQSRT